MTGMQLLLLCFSDTRLLLLCFRGLKLLLVSREMEKGPSADTQRLMLMLDLGNFQRVELEVGSFTYIDVFMLFNSHRA